MRLGIIYQCQQRPSRERKDSLIPPHPQLVLSFPSLPLDLYNAHKHRRLAAPETNPLASSPPLRQDQLATVATHLFHAQLSHAESAVTFELSHVTLLPRNFIEQLESDVDFHSHKPDQADERGHRTLQKRREEVRDCLLQKQGSIVENESVSRQHKHTIPRASRTVDSLQRAGPGGGTAESHSVH